MSTNETMIDLKLGSVIRYEIPTTLRDAIADVPAPHATYQQGLLSGTETWSGSSLKGEAKQWGSQYKASREALLQRIHEVAILTGWHATTQLVLIDSRWTRQLVLTHECGKIALY